MNEDDAVRLDTRLAGQVRRFHTWPIVGQQTIAEHCWHLMRIYLCVVEEPDPHVITHIMFHDIGEHYTGDIPYPVKSENPVLKKEMDFLEQKSYMAQMEYWSAFYQVRLSDQDKALFKQIELVEMAEYGLDQVALGNSHGYIIANRCLKAVYEGHPPPRLVNYIIKRIKIFRKQCVPCFAYDMDEEWWFYAKWGELNDSK